MKVNRKNVPKIRLCLVLIAAVLVFWGPGTTPMVAAEDFGALLGRWQRVDGGYVIEVLRIRANGQMEAGYYNPRPINVAHARASFYGDKIKIELVLRDKGYPGSAYTLVYAADKDVLIGYYFHAPTRQNIDVLFVRMK